VPIKRCDKHEISALIDSSVIVEEIGNVYFLNDSQWFAVNDSFIKYNCINENDIMVGKNVR